MDYIYLLDVKNTFSDAYYRAVGIDRLGVVLCVATCGHLYRCVSHTV